MRKQKQREIKTKNFIFYFSFYHYLWDWALPLYVSVETYHRDYIEIYLHVLCLTFSFMRISHEYLEELDNFMENIE